MDSDTLVKTLKNEDFKTTKTNFEDRWEFPKERMVFIHEDV